MTAWHFWIILGVVFVLLEFIVPGGIIVFLGTSALIVALGIHFEWITNLSTALLTWFISSIFLVICLRGFFIKYFEGDSSVQNTDEDEDMVGSIVIVVESVFPYKEGRVKFRDSTWTARSDHELKPGDKAIVKKREGNCLIVTSL